MQLDTIVVSEAEAREKIREYEDALKAERNLEDEALAMAYRAARRGLPLISLKKVIQAGGFFPNGLPKIAIIRADAKQCYTRWSGNDLLFYDGDLYDGWRNQNRTALVNKVSVRVPDLEKPAVTRRWDGTTVVPSVPPRYRPRRPRRLSRTHVLWEVESWTSTPPRDPALLRHIRGDLWVVLATWDLTELERYVLAQR